MITYVMIADLMDSTVFPSPESMSHVDILEREYSYSTLTNMDLEPPDYYYKHYPLIDEIKLLETKLKERLEFRLK